MAEQLSQMDILHGTSYLVRKFKNRSITIDEILEEEGGLNADEIRFIKLIWNAHTTKGNIYLSDELVNGKLTPNENGNDETSMALLRINLHCHTRLKIEKVNSSHELVQEYMKIAPNTFNVYARKRAFFIIPISKYGAMLTAAIPRCGDKWWNCFIKAEQLSAMYSDYKDFSDEHDLSNIVCNLPENEKIKKIATTIKYAESSFHQLAKFLGFSKSEINLIDLYSDYTYYDEWIYLSNDKIRNVLPDKIDISKVDEYVENVLASNFNSEIDFKQIDASDPLVKKDTEDNIENIVKKHFIVSCDAYKCMLIMANNDRGREVRRSILKVENFTKKAREYDRICMQNEIDRLQNIQIPLINDLASMKTNLKRIQQNLK